MCKTIDGEECHKPIEDVQVGDMVFAYDEETGKSDWKPVVRLFRNTTLTTNTHYFEGEKEPIVCTPEHPFYILNTTTETPIVRFEGREESRYDGQWVQSKYLKIGDQVLLSDGKTVILTRTETEHLSEPITTYNFEVADFHTYYVGEQGILVHNACPPDLYRGGNKMNVRGRDVDIIDDLVQPTRGISVNSNPEAVANFGGANKIGTLPKGLKIVHTGGTHYEIIPKYAMSLSKYQLLLNQIPLTPFG